MFISVFKPYKKPVYVMERAYLLLFFSYVVLFFSLVSIMLSIIFQNNGIIVIGLAFLKHRRLFLSFVI